MGQLMRPSVKIGATFGLAEMARTVIQFLLHSHMDQSFRVFRD